MIHDTQYSYFGNHMANSYGDGYIVIFDLDENNDIIGKKSIEA